METELYSEHGEKFDNKHEGKVARSIEKRTAKLPSDLFLWAAGASVLGSLAFQILGRRRNFAPPIAQPLRAPTASFIGMWAPTFLLLGLYNKIVKLFGSDRVTG